MRTIQPLDLDAAEAPSRAPRPSPRPSEYPEVQALMLQLASGDRFERLGAIVQEHLLTGGKGLRVRLALSAAELLGVPDTEANVWPAACELLHNASLIHDDLQDRDPLRRGRYSVWVRHGDAQAINAGDLLLMLPFIALEGLSADGAVCWELSRALARRAEETVRGQSLEMSLFGSQRFDWESYEAAARGKTSALMALPIHGALLLAGRPPERAAGVGDAFRDLGLMFQMQDDVSDLYGLKEGRRAGGDVREGRVTAPLVAHLARRPDDLDWLGPILGRPREETSDADVDRVAAALRDSGALQDVLRRIRRLEAAFLAHPAFGEEPSLAPVARELSRLSLSPLAPLEGGAA